MRSSPLRSGVGELSEATSSCCIAVSQHLVDLMSVDVELKKSLVWRDAKPNRCRKTVEKQLSVDIRDARFIVPPA